MSTVKLPINNNPATYILEPTKDCNCMGIWRSNKIPVKKIDFTRCQYNVAYDFFQFKLGLLNL